MYNRLVTRSHKARQKARQRQHDAHLPTSHMDGIAVRASSALQRDGQKNVRAHKGSPAEHSESEVSSKTIPTPHTHTLLALAFARFCMNGHFPSKVSMRPASDQSCVKGG